MALSSPAFFLTTHSSSPSSSSSSVKLLHSHRHPFTLFHFPATSPTIHTLSTTSTSSATSDKWIAKVSFFPAFLNRGKKDAKTLKDELLDAIAPLDRGADATPEDQQRVDQAVLWDVLVKFLPDDAHIRCNGRVRDPLEAQGAAGR